MLDFLLASLNAETLSMLSGREVSDTESWNFFASECDLMVGPGGESLRVDIIFIPTSVLATSIGIIKKSTFLTCLARGSFCDDISL